MMEPTAKIRRPTQLEAALNIEGSSFADSTSDTNIKPLKLRRNIITKILFSWGYPDKMLELPQALHSTAVVT